jgi:hypothetical protein
MAFGEAGNLVNSLWFASSMAVSTIVRAILAIEWLGTNNHRKRTNQINA